MGRDRGNGGELIGVTMTNKTSQELRELAKKTLIDKGFNVPETNIRIRKQNDQIIVSWPGSVHIIIFTII